MNTYSRFINRLDKQLTGFDAISGNNAGLLKAVCQNSATGYVRQLKTGGSVNVPNHAADAVAKHLATLGWVQA